MLKLISASEESTRVSAARVLGVALKFNPDAAFQSILETEILAEPGNVGVEVVHGRCLALGQVLRYNAERCAASHAAIIDRIDGLRCVDAGPLEQARIDAVASEYADALAEFVFRDTVGLGWGKVLEGEDSEVQE